MIRPGDCLSLRIEDVVYRGRGLARHEGQVVFVEGVAPGELVRARVAACKRRYAEATVAEVLEPSPDRRPPCARLTDGVQVPGCVYDHLDYAAEVALKERQLRSFLRDLEGDAPADAWQPPLPSPRPLHYRNKIVLHAQRAGRGALRIGYFGADNRTVVDVPACPLARPEIGAAWAAARPAWRRDLRDGQRLTWRLTTADGALCWVDGAPAGAPLLTEESAAGPLLVPRDGFYQVNTEVADALVRQVRAWFLEARCEGCDDLLDLYCGVGVFGLSCAAAGVRRLYGIESGAAAVAAARLNARRLGSDATYRCADVAVALPEVCHALNAQRLVAVVDPPRQGMTPGAVAALAAAAPAHIVYVSCDPATLARDLRLLRPRGYRLRAARLFDMFPRTAHFESAVWLALRT